MSPAVTHLVRRVLAQYLAIDTSDVSPSQDLERDLGLTQLDLVLAALRLEEGFGSEFPFAQLDDVRTVTDLVVVVEAWLVRHAARSRAANSNAAEPLWPGSHRPWARGHERGGTPTSR